MRVPRRWLLTLVALVLLLPAGGIAIAQTHLLSASPQAEPGAPDLSKPPIQPGQPHHPPAEFTPAAKVDAQAHRAAAGVADNSQLLADNASPTPRAGGPPQGPAPQLTPPPGLTPVPTSQPAGPFAGFYPTPAPGQTAPPARTSTASPTAVVTTSATPTPAPHASATSRPTPRAGGVATPAP